MLNVTTNRRRRYSFTESGMKLDDLECTPVETTSQINHRSLDRRSLRLFTSKIERPRILSFRMYPPKLLPTNEGRLLLGDFPP